MDLLISCCTQPAALREERAHCPQVSWSPLGEEIVMDPLNRSGGGRGRERSTSTQNVLLVHIIVYCTCNGFLGCMGIQGSIYWGDGGKLLPQTS